MAQGVAVVEEAVEPVDFGEAMGVHANVAYKTMKIFFGGDPEAQAAKCAVPAMYPQLAETRVYNQLIRIILQCMSNGTSGGAAGGTGRCWRTA